jgi:hypothetical protein
MIAHRWQRYEEAAFWRCDPPELVARWPNKPALLGLTGAEGSCAGCRFIVTDEHVAASLPTGSPAWLGANSSWLNALAKQSVEWWAERGMAAPAVQSVQTWLPS